MVRAASSGHVTRGREGAAAGLHTPAGVVAVAAYAPGIPEGGVARGWEGPSAAAVAVVGLRRLGAVVVAVVVVVLGLLGPRCWAGWCRMWWCTGSQ